jgi:hypothetical protein
LTRELVRCKVVDGRVVPLLLRPTAAMRDLTGSLLAGWRALVGHPRHEVDEATGPLVHGARSAVVARGLVRVLERRCTFTEPVCAAALRAQACAASARLLDTPAATPADHRAAVARELGWDPDALATALYADLPQEARLETMPALTEVDLIDAYNLALVQGLLLSADGLAVTVRDPDVGRRRRLLKALRFHRLLAEVAADDAGLRLTVGGPRSVLDRQGQYGLQFACFLPHLCTAKDWDLTARLHLPDGREGELRLDHASGLRAGSRFIAFVPEELAALGAQLARREPDWRIDDEAPVLRTATGELVVADLRLHLPAGDWCVECFHRWHARSLARRLEQKMAGELPRLIIAVARDLLRLAEHAALAARVEAAPWAFAFTGFPTARALRDCIARLTTTAPTG